MPDSNFWDQVREHRDGPGAHVDEVLQRLYDSEINLRIGWIWDGGVSWQLGDKHNGYKATGRSKTVGEAIQAMAAAALEHYPQSSFAAWWRGR